jgi:hypothetical protein
MEVVGFTVMPFSDAERNTSQDGCTKDVFKEMDVFLYLMSVLSSIQDCPT